MRFLKFLTAVFSLSLALVFTSVCQAKDRLPSDWAEDTPQASEESGHSQAGSIAGLKNQMSRPSRLMLKGQVEHTERLPPTGAGLCPGADFRESNLPPVQPSSEWYRIPKWFAGTFRVDEAVVMKSFEYLTGRTAFLNRKLPSQGQETRGFQKDARGDIWNLSTTSGTSRSEESDRYTYNIIHWYGPEEINEGRVVMRILATSVVVDKRSGKIQSVFRREDIKTYVAIKSGVVSVSYTSKSFNSDGIPQDLQTGFSAHQQIAGFKPINRMGDTDLRAMFRDYLLANNLPYLVPD